MLHKNFMCNKKFCAFGAIELKPSILRRQRPIPKVRVHPGPFFCKLKLFKNYRLSAYFVGLVLAEKVFVGSAFFSNPNTICKNLNSASNCFFLHFFLSVYLHLIVIIRFVLQAVPSVASLPLIF